MNDKQLISKLRELKQIKPNQNWVVSLKKDIIGEEKKVGILDVLPRIIFGHKLAYAAVSVFAVLFGLFGFAQHTVPGDPLFSIKKITEQSQGVLLSGAQQSKYNLDIANKRLKDLTAIIKDKKTNNIASAIREVKQSVTNAAKDLNNDSQDLNETINQIIHLDVLAALDNSQIAQIGDALLPITVQQLIKSLEKNTLTEDQQKILIEIKDLYKEGNYNEALIKILYLNHNSSN